MKNRWSKILAVYIFIGLLMLISHSSLISLAEESSALAATTIISSWGTNGNENSMGIQAD